jgi:hypothetical protein
VTDRSFFVPRHAKERIEGEAASEPRPLEAWRDSAAYVLLAEPGAGKTRAFKSEAEATGGDYVTARRFITLGFESAASDATLFIDGLDEIRAGSPSRRKPLDEIVTRLNQLGRPRFRIACREADWLGAVDRNALRAVASNGELTELHLMPLGDVEVLQVLKRDPRTSASATALLDNAKRQGVQPLLGNPLLLKLVIEAVQGNQSPSSRASLYQLACEQLAVEYNEEHRAEIRLTPSTEVLLDDAGLLSALLLLSGSDGFSARTTLNPPAESALVESIPTALGLCDPHAALSSKVFVADGEIRVPLHRTVAEYLAARAIAARVQRGLPIGRVLALMSGLDGGIVEPLRGLHAWLAVHCMPNRRELIDRDPLGVVLYGDLTSFTTIEKEHVLQALHREAQRFAWFRRGQWDAHPFGALATKDMVATFDSLLTAPNRDLAHQSLLDCVLDAIEHSLEPSALVELRLPLERLVRDDSFNTSLRASALQAWLRLAPTELLPARALLDQINSYAVSDPDDELAGLLLDSLYPAYMSTGEVLNYLHRPKRESFFGTYRHFWNDALIDRTSPSELPLLADQWLQARFELKGQQWDIDRNQLSGRLLAATVRHCGETVPIDRLYKWLGAGIDEHGFAALRDDDAAPLREWLIARPELQKALVAYGWTKVRKDPSSGRRFFWESETRLFGSTRPADWYAWLLEQAASTDDEALARYCFDGAAHAALNRLPGYDITMEQVEDWVQSNKENWPGAETWLGEEWSVSLDHWERDEFRRKAEHSSKEAELRRERRCHIEPHLAALMNGTAPLGLMMQVAYAYDDRYMDIRGESSLARVQDLLGGSIAEAASVVNGLVAALSRNDLPSVEEILKIDAKQQHHNLRPVCLLGARLAMEHDADVWRHWQEDLARRLVAFWLTEGLGEPPGWYEKLCAQHPDWVASVLVPFAVQRIRKQAQSNIAGLWSLAQDEAPKELARIVLPELLQRFPARADEAQLRVLNGELLRAASRHLPSELIGGQISRRLTMKSLDAGQRIAWLVAGVAIDAEKYSRLLVDFVRERQSHAAQLALALEQQAGRRRSAASASAKVLGRLIELIAPHATPERPEGAFWVGNADRRRDLLNDFINQLASQDSAEAAAELDRLRSSPALQRWTLSLDAAAFEQQRVARAAAYRHPTIAETAYTLASLAPANPLDLAALVLEYLQDVQKHLRGDDSNRLKLFRRDDGRTPKVENDCRDVLLPMLRERASRVGVHIEAEGRSAREGRTDMRASIVRPKKRIAVPIEVKKENHRALWSAWRTQLNDLYSTDPAADGAGIYLVLWFGEEVVAPPSGKRPVTPTGLQSALSQLIEPEDRVRLNVVVLDLSLPSKA